MKTTTLLSFIKLQIASMSALAVLFHSGPSASAQAIQFTQTGNFTPPGAVGGAHTAGTVGIAGTTAMVSWSQEPSGGVVYVLERAADGQWIQKQVISPSIPQPGSDLGEIAMSASRAVIGRPCSKKYDALTQQFIPDAGDAFIFEKQASGMWTEVAVLSAFTGPNDKYDYFGAAVALDGDRVLVGIQGDNLPNFYRCGSAQLFERQPNGAWAATARLIASDPDDSAGFGDSVALAGNIMIVGASRKDYKSHEFQSKKYVGAAYIFERNSLGAWIETAKLLAADGASGDHFGTSVAISGSVVAVGAPYHDAYGLPNSGAVYVFEKEVNGKWMQTAKIADFSHEGGDMIGYSIAMDGSTLIAGVPQISTLDPSVKKHSAAAVFRRSVDGQFVKVAALLVLPHDDSNAVSAVAVSGEYAVLGEPYYWASASQAEVGRARFYRFSSNSVSSFGTGTPGCDGTQSMLVNAPPMPGLSNFQLYCSNTPAASLGLGIVTDVADYTGTDPYQLGVLFHVDLLQSTELIGFDMVSNNPSFPTNAYGTATLSIPNNPLLVGKSFYAMSLWYWDPLLYSSCSSSLNHLSTSRGIKFTVLQQ